MPCPNIWNLKHSVVALYLVDSAILCLAGRGGSGNYKPAPVGRLINLLGMPCPFGLTVRNEQTIGGIER